MKLHPEVAVDLSLSDRVVNLLDEGYEAAIRIGPMTDSNLLARSLAPFNLMVCASPDYIAAHGAPQHPADLAHHDCLGFAYWAPGERWSFIGPEGEITVNVRSRYRINNGAALRAAALAGAGIILQSEALLSDDVAQGKLVPVLTGYKPPSRSMCVVWLPDRRPTPKVRSFIDFVVEQFG
jgi:DNA-binding transcriptional LysR family regulator